MTVCWRNTERNNVQAWLAAKENYSSLQNETRMRSFPFLEKNKMKDHDAIGFRKELISMLFLALSVFLLVVLAFSFLVFFYHDNSFKLNGSVFHHRYLLKA